MRTSKWNIWRIKLCQQITKIVFIVIITFIIITIYNLRYRTKRETKMFLFVSRMRVIHCCSTLSCQLAREVRTIYLSCNQMAINTSLYITFTETAMYHWKQFPVCREKSWKTISISTHGRKYYFVLRRTWRLRCNLIPYKSRWKW